MRQNIDCWPNHNEMQAAVSLEVSWLAVNCSQWVQEAERKGKSSTIIWHFLCPGNPGKPLVHESFSQMLTESTLPTNTVCSRCTPL